MKTIFIVVAVLCLGLHTVKGQAKQQKELLLQIAALQIYIDYAKKGYSAMKNGLSFIGDLKKGEVNLHSDYFTSLKKVNPKIKRYYRVAEIMAMQLKIIKSCKTVLREIRADDLFHGDEISYIERAFDRLIENCSRNLDELLVVTSNGKVELSDDQRLERIDALYKAVSNDYQFCKTFGNETKVLAISRTREKNDVKSGNKLYGIQN